MLNEKQDKFAQAYVLHRNATEAAKAAGYAAESAYNQGYRLLQNQEVVDRVHELEQELETDVNVIEEIENQYEFAKSNGHYCPVFVVLIVILVYLWIRIHWRLLLLAV